MAKILVVDDEPAFLMMLKTVLQNYGHEVTPLSSSKEALVQLRGAGDKLPDLLILDLMMPGMDGFTFLSALQQEGLAPDLPIIFISAKSGAKDVVLTYPNVSAFLEKPIELAVLKAAVEKALV